MLRLEIFAHAIISRIFMDGYIAGIVSGLSQVALGHPLDTLKTWQQSANVSAISTRALWRGVQYPLIQLPIICGVSFGLYENVYTYTNNCVTASAISGLLRTPIVTPLEYYKIRAQSNAPILWKQCFRNMHVVSSREMLSATAYFSSYSTLRKTTGLPIMVSGGIAGMAAWACIYPIDTIKTRLQSGTAANVWDAWKQRGLWGGLSACLARAFLVNALGFYAYEHTREYMKKFHEK